MFETIATACSGLFAGAAIYISVVQHPAGLESGQAMAATFFSPMYRRAAPMQAGLALIGTAAGIVAWLLGAGLSALLGALILVSVVPFTLVVIKPINDRLQSPQLDPSGAEVPELLRRWGTLHGVRSVAGAVSFAAFLYGRAAAG